MPKAMSKQKKYEELHEMLGNSMQITEIMQGCMQVIQLAGADSVDEEVLGCVARHQSTVATMVKAVQPVLPTSIIEGFSKWAILNPVWQQAVEL